MLNIYAMSIIINVLSFHLNNSCQQKKGFWVSYRNCEFHSHFHFAKNHEMCEELFRPEAEGHRIELSVTTFV